jgi:glyoxylase-like metal-dependent hydrolase (beta-lactamase superfamily II)
MKISLFTFNPFAENTYLLEGDNKECIIVDPGMVNGKEEQELFTHIEQKGLKPIRLVNTHCHIDHVLGFHAIYKKYGLEPEFTKEEQMVFEACPRVADMYGIPYLHYTGKTKVLDPKKPLKLGKEEIEIRFVPGHAPGHIVMVDHAAGNVIAGDTLFNGSVGRTDLPGAVHDLLMKKIKSELYTLPGNFTVWPGHGPETTIEKEKKTNPFVRA